MKNTLCIIMLLPLAISCVQDSGQIVQENEIKNDMIFHYSVLKALDNGVLESTMTVGELKKHGGHGLGTYNELNGELIAMDEVIYQVKADGKVLVPEDESLIPYAVVCFYQEEHDLQMEGEIDYPSLTAFVEERIPSFNLFYAIRISGTFNYIKCGSANKQVRPYDKSIAEMLEGRPVFKAENISGTLVGYWCPEYIGDINSDGFHLHFLSDDLSMGGHLLEFQASELEIGYDIKYEYKFVLPETEDFRNAFFRDAEVNY